MGVGGGYEGMRGFILHVASSGTCLGTGHNYGEGGFKMGKSWV